MYMRRLAVGGGGRWTGTDNTVTETARCSAGRTPEQFVDIAALALSRTARAALASSHHDDFLAGRRGRAIVDIALRGDRRAGPLGDHPHDDHDALAAVLAQPHLITGPDRMRGFDPDPVDPDVPGPAGAGRGRAGLGQPHRPDPAVHPPRLITGHSATVMRRISRRPPRAPGPPSPAAPRRGPGRIRTPPGRRASGTAHAPGPARPAGSRRSR